MSGDGRADIGTHDVSGGLDQTHDAGVNKANDHDGGGPARLHDHRGEGSNTHPGEFGFCRFGKELFQPAGSEFFRGGLKHIHAHEQSAQPADHQQNRDPNGGRGGIGEERDRSFHFY